MNDQIPYCVKCGGLVKPEITFFGEDLPLRFGKLAQVDFKKCDLLIVLGTSLQVEPFNRLITRVPAKCPRLLINRDRAGEEMRMGFDFDDKWKHSVKRDALFLGNCDEGVRKLAELCGWEVRRNEKYCNPLVFIGRSSKTIARLIYTKSTLIYIRTSSRHCMKRGMLK